MSNKQRKHLNARPSSPSSLSSLKPSHRELPQFIQTHPDGTPLPPGLRKSHKNGGLYRGESIESADARHQLAVAISDLETFEKTFDLRQELLKLEGANKALENVEEKVKEFGTPKSRTELRRLADLVLDGATLQGAPERKIGDDPIDASLVSDLVKASKTALTARDYYNGLVHEHTVLLERIHRATKRAANIWRGRGGPPPVRIGRSGPRKRKIG